MNRISILGISISLSVGIGLLFPASGGAADRDASLYVGVKVCGMCHKKEDSGNQLASWQKGPHSKTFERLGTPEAKAAAAKLGIADPQKSAKCLKCHSTAYNWTEQVATEKIQPEDGVTCESCHGPGKKYMPKSVMEDRKKCIENGMVYPASKSCELCHNDQNPTWKADRYTTKDGKKVGFDFEQAYEKIKHPNPKVKH
ncbi:MAG: cytochrome c family protein [Verrucomicrobia bacterium]|nr:cytochrome c family protein [Verrucomicrobiota bacterium]